MKRFKYPQQFQKYLNSGCYQKIQKASQFLRKIDLFVEQIAISIESDAQFRGVFAEILDCPLEMFERLGEIRIEKVCSSAPYFLFEILSPL